jgi:hypothetical protein
MMRRSVTPTVALLLAVFGGIADAQPANDDCADATVIASLPFTDAVDTSAATTEAGDPTFECDDGNAYGQEARSVWYRYTSTAGGPIEIDTFGSDYDTIVNAWRGPCGSLGDLVSCNNTDYDASYSGDQSRLVVALGAGETILIEVLSDAAAGGNLVLHVNESSVFQVTDEVVYSSEHPDVAAAADGTFVVVWEDEDSYTIKGRRFCDTGAPLGPPFTISVPDYPTEPHVVRSGDDGFVVVWIDDFTLQGRRLGATGTPLGPQFEVSSDYPNYFNFDLGADASGGFVVTWERDGSDGDDQGVVAQRFDATNTPLGPTFVVNTYTTGFQFDPTIAVDPSGNFLIAWESQSGQDGSSAGVFAQRYDASGAAAGGEFQVNVSTVLRQDYPAATADLDGNFVIAWHDGYQNCGPGCVIGRRYDPSGTPQSGEFVVSDGTTGPPYYYNSIDVDTSATGDFVVAWADENDFPRARAFAADGTPQGGAFQASLVEDDYQRNVRLAVADDGDFVVVWEWAAQGSHYKIMARSQVQNPSCPALGGCPATPRVGCKQPTVEGKGNLTLRDRSPDTGDTAVWKWLRGEATTITEIGDALSTDSYSFCLYDASNALLAATTLPPGGTCDARPCWKDLGGLGFRYSDRTGANGLVRKLVVKAGDAGKPRVIVKTQGEDLAFDSLPPSLPVRAQLASTTGVCWEGEFRAEGVTKSTSTVFGAKVSIGSPSEAFVD